MTSLRSFLTCKNPDTLLCRDFFDILVVFCYLLLLPPPLDEDAPLDLLMLPELLDMLGAELLDILGDELLLMLEDEDEGLALLLVLEAGARYERLVVVELLCMR